MIYTARVITGRGEGHTLGFPTLNLDIPSNFETSSGIYAARVWLDSSREETLSAAIHYGPVPAFGIDRNSLEVHVINKDIARPPAELSFELVKYLRPVMNFSSIEALKAQIQEDVRATREILEGV